MPASEALTDEYITALLLKSTSRISSNSSKYDILPTSKPRSKDAPRPNTRFLKNIIRDTDSHNAALKVKEEAESRARLRELASHEEKHTRDGAKPKVDGERQGRWSSALGGLGSSDVRKESGKKRRRDVRGEKVSTIEETQQTRKERPDDRPSRWAHALGGLGTTDGPSRAKRQRENDEDRKPDRKRRRSMELEEPGSTYRKLHHTHRHQPRSRSPHSGSRRHRQRSGSASPASASNSRHRLSPDPTISDPHDDFLGPAAPSSTIPRGRGANRSAFDSMDSRFASSYDPKTDVALDPDDDAEDDWDMALEALRDRTKWQSQKSDRLRAAGFSEEEVKSFEESGREKGIGDVKWKGKGEGREWDRGKGEDGEVEIAWAKATEP